MDYHQARAIWDDQVNQTPTEFLRECTIPELERGFPAIAHDYVEFYVRNGDFDALSVKYLADLEHAIAVVLDHESLIS